MWCNLSLLSFQTDKHQQISGRLQDIRSKKQMRKTELEALDRKYDQGIMEVKQLQQQLEVCNFLLRLWFSLTVFCVSIMLLIMHPHREEYGVSWIAVERGNGQDCQHCRGF